MSHEFYDFFYNKEWKNDFKKHPNASDSIVECVIIEPRCHKYLEGVLKNISFIFPNCALTIIHSKMNKDFLYNIVGNYENVKKIELFEENISINNYNSLLRDSNFYKLFDSEFILIFQTDSGAFYNNILHFLEYDYVGAPWKSSDPNKGHVGNGGFSLRNKKVMEEISDTYFYYDRINNEDCFFSNIIKNNNKYKYCPFETGKLFSIEQIFNNDSMAFHSQWHSPNLFIELTKQYNYETNNNLEILDVNNNLYLLKWVKTSTSINRLFIMKNTKCPINENLKIKYIINNEINEVIAKIENYRLVENLLIE